MTSAVMCKHVCRSGCRLVIFLLMQSNQILAQCHVTNVRGVKTADCVGRRLRTIPTAQSVDIRALRLADNLISSLASDSFRSYGPTLIDLNLARNDISSLDAAAFRGLHGVQVVDLESNLLQSIPTEALQEIPSVRILVLKNNHIRSIGHEDLAPLLNVEELNLENCRLQQIAPAAFRRLVRLLELNLADNELVTLDPATEGQLPTSLTVVRLTGNPWLCDCRLRWLRKWLAASTADNVTSSQQQKVASSLSAFNWDLAPSIPTCSGPAGSSLAGVDWRSIKPQQFACSARVRLISPIVIEDEGGAGADVQDDVMSPRLPDTVVAIRCIATGDPLPVVTWSQVTQNGVLQLTSNAKIDVHRNNLENLLSPSREHHEQIVESVLSITAEQQQQISETPAGSAEFKCQAENSAGKDQATYRVNSPRINSRFVVVSTAYDHRRVEYQTTPSGIRLAEPEVLIGCGLFAVCLLTILVIGVVCWTAVSARSRINRLGDSVVNKKPDDVDVVRNNVDAAVISTPGSVDNLSHVTESVLSSLNTAVVWQKSSARSSAAVWGSFVRSQSSSCATHAVGNGMHPGVNLDQSETASISLRQFDTRSVYSCGGYSEYEDDVLEEKMAADFRFRLFEPRKPWSVSDGDVRLVPRRDNCSTSLEEAYDRRRVLTVRHVMTSKHAHDFRSRSSAISRYRPTAATRLVGSRNEFNVVGAGGRLRRYPGAFTKPQTVYGTAAAVAVEYQI